LIFKDGVMFTGIIEKTGKVKSFGSNRLEVQVDPDFSVKLGDSVCVNGVCLTVSGINSNILGFDVSKESLSHTDLSSLKANDTVNLERAMPADGRFGGHFVTGHVDTIGKISKVVNNGSSIDMYVEYDEKYSLLMVSKGSVAVNGVSLTVNEVEDKKFRLTLIPYTLKETNLLGQKAGDTVNLEFDILAKYINKMVSKKPGSKLTEEYLRGLGYE